jgi:hypothetical protein
MSGKRLYALEVGTCWRCARSLVRCDENLKAHTLLQECVPHFLAEDHPLVDQARIAQERMVEHITGGGVAYQRYYSTNEHERRGSASVRGAGTKVVPKAVRERPLTSRRRGEGSEAQPPGKPADRLRPPDTSLGAHQGPLGV